MSVDNWLDAVDRHPETLDTDLLVAALLAQHPERLWSLSDVLLGLHLERDLSDLQDAVGELVSNGFLVVVVYVFDCDDGCSGYCSGCRDPLRGDVLLELALP